MNWSFSKTSNRSILLQIHRYLHSSVTSSKLEEPASLRTSSTPSTSSLLMNQNRFFRYSQTLETQNFQKARTLLYSMKPYSSDDDNVCWRRQRWWLLRLVKEPTIHKESTSLLHDCFWLKVANLVTGIC
jgi:hypothetical protein